MPRYRKSCEPRVSGCLQVGAGRLEILGEDTYPDGSKRLHYRIIGDVLPYWGAQPVPGSTYLFQEGCGPRTVEELQRDWAQILAPGSTHLMGYRGPISKYAYRAH